MTKKIIIAAAIFLLTQLAPAQQVNFKFGLVSPLQSSDLWEDNLYNLSYEKADFQALNFSVEYLQQFHKHLGFYLEGSRYNKTVTADYRDYEYSDGSAILQSMHLSMTALEAGIRFNILPYRSAFSPFIGAGVGLYFWQYEQYGDFIDFQTDEIYEGFSDQEAIAVGLHVKGGLAIRVSRNFGLLLEGKVHWAEGELGEYFEGFEPFDLSALSLSVGFEFYF